MKRALTALALCVHAASAQTPSFEVASVNPAVVRQGMPMMETVMGDEMHFRQAGPDRLPVTLKMLLKRG